MENRDPIPKSYPVSPLYGIIPSAIRSRIPILKSLSSKSIHTSIEWTHSRTLSSPELGYGKTRQSFSSASTVVSTGMNTPTRPNTPDSNDCLTLKGDDSQLWQQETKSGVDWDIAAAGIRLWIYAKTQAEQGYDSKALRSMHIDSLRYMHMALPQDLSIVELDSLRSSIPTYILSDNTIQKHAPQSNRLRNQVAYVVSWIVTHILFLLPLIMTILSRILQYERNHQVTEKMIANGLNLANIVGEQGLELQDSINRFKHGRVGGACFNAGSWFIEGIIGGLNDGIIQGTKSIS